jgi:DNA-binding NtrC family response regulator/tetratricopeptide (TPR) repeat protein
MSKSSGSTAGFHPRYRLLDVLGEGGMGTVHVAEDLLEDGQRVALKTYPAGTPVELLRREFLSLRKLRHPGFARAYHFGVQATDGRPFYTMELLRGTPLDAHVAALAADGRSGGGWRPETAAFREALELLVQAASALAHLHRHRLLHLDIKPGNLLVLPGGGGAPPLLVLIDFGLVRVLGEESPATRGTLPYMAPELLRGQAVDARADLYAAGVAFYRAFTGRLPFAGESPAALLRSMQGGAPPAPELPAPLERILLKLLARSAAHRFASADALLDALRALRKGFGASLPPALPMAEAVETVGREAELDALARWIEDPRRPFCLAIHGAPGIGKSRLIEEAEARLSVAGLPVVYVRREGDDELALFRDVLRRVALELPPSDAERAGAPLVFAADGLIGPLAPAAAGGRSSAAGSSRFAEGELLRQARGQGSAWLRRRFLDGGLFLALDDADAAPAGPPSFLSEIARSAQRAAAQGASNDGARRRGGLLLGLMRPPPRDLAAGTAIELGPLAPAAVERWLELQLGPERRSRRARQAFYRETRGVPALVALSLQADARSDLVPDGDSRWRRRLEAISPSGRRLAALAALVGRPAPPAMLGAAAGLDAQKTARELRLLEAAGIVFSERGGRVRFASSAFREPILAVLDPAARRELHRALGALPAASPAARVEAAYHLFEAGDDAGALALAAAAGELEPIDPLRAAPRTLEVLERAGRHPRLDPRLRLPLLETLADRFQERGQLADADRIWSHLASSGRSRSKADLLRIRRKRAHTRYLLGDVAVAESELRACLELLPASRPGADRLAVLAELAVIAHYRQEPDRALDWASRGIEEFKSLPPALRSEGLQQAVHLHGIVGQVLIRKLDFEGAARVLEDGAALAKGHAVNALVLLNNLGLAYHLAGRLQEALTSFRSLEKLVEDLHDENARLSIACNIAQILAKQGRFAEARRTLESLAESPALADSARLSLSVLYTRTLVDGLERPGVEDGWTRVEAAAGALGDVFLEAFAASYQAEAALFRRRWQEALGHLERCEERSRQLAAEPSLFLRRMLRSRQALALAGLKRESEALALLDGGSGAAAAVQGALLGWDHCFRAAALVELERSEEAADAYAAAAIEFRRWGIGPGDIEARLGQAEAFLAGGSLERCRRILARLRGDIARGRLPPAVRHLGIRLALLESRLTLNAPDLWIRPKESIAEVQDLLAHAEGEPVLEKLPELRCDCACIRYALARLSGDAAAERAGRSRLLGQAGAGARSAKPSLAQLRGALRRAALSRYATPEGVRAGEALREPQVECLESMLRPPEGGAPGAASSVAAWLSAAAAALGGDRAVLLEVDAGAGRAAKGNARVLHAWPGAAPARWPLPQGLAPIAPVASVQKRDACPEQLRRALDALGGAAAGWRTLYVGPLRPWAPRPRIVLIASSRPLSETCEGDRRFFDDVLNAVSARLEPSAGAAAALKQRPAPATGTQDLTRAIERARAGGPEPPTQLVAQSGPMQRILATIQELEDSDLPVLITGDSGTGKDTVARAVHRFSRRRDRPFIVQNVGSIPAALFEADLFGHKRGAFTGAERTRSGYLLQAQGGTFLLDEIADAEPLLQQKLLRLLEDGSFRPVGGERVMKLDVRFLASSQADLEALVRSGGFRKDLYYRLRGIHIHLPPLRERPDDILPLCRFFFSRLCGFAPRLSADVEALLVAHPWPGNVRELRSFVQRLSLQRGVKIDRIERADVESALGPGGPAGPIAPGLFLSHSYDELRRQLDLAHLRHLFELHRGDLAAMARALGASTRSMYRSFERLGLKPKDLLRPEFR